MCDADENTSWYNERGRGSDGERMRVRAQLRAGIIKQQKEINVYVREHYAEDKSRDKEHME